MQSPCLPRRTTLLLAAFLVLLLATGRWLRADDATPDAKEADVAEADVADEDVSDEDVAEAEKVLAKNGIKSSRSGFSIKEESELADGLKAAKKLRAKMFRSRKTLKKVEEKEDAARGQIKFLFAKRSELRKQLNKTSSVKSHNEIVNTLNEIGDRIVMLQEGKELEEELSAARGEFNTARETYVAKLLELREVIDNIKDRYGDLKSKKDVKAAAELVASAAGKDWKLGKSRKLAGHWRELNKMSDVVITERIELRKGRGKTYYVAVTINGNKTEEMVLDTGASIVSLPYDVAKRVGLTPSDDDPKVQLKLADGSIVEGTTVFAKSIRVGKFVVENVQCAVMPEHLTEAAHLLGQSFLDKFSYRVDSASNALIINKVNEPGR